MVERTLGDEIVTIAEDVVSKIPTNINCKVIGNYSNSGYVDVKLTDGTVLEYIQCIGNDMVGIDGLLTFINADSNNPLVITNNEKINMENTILALGLGLFKIGSDGDLYVELPNQVENPFSINSNGDLLVDLPTGAVNEYEITDNGDLVYDRWDI